MKVAFLFLPPWDPTYPSYAMALFKASTIERGHDFIGFDLNVDLYNAVRDEDKKLWEAQHATLWDVDPEKFIDKYSEYLDLYIEKIVQHKIDLYALSIICFSKHLAFYLTQRIKELIPNAAILIGGPQCFPANDGLSILENIYVDAICTGEGDIIWPKILEHFDKEKDLQIDLPGLAYKTNDGSIVDNGAPELVKDLNSIPFADYREIDFAKYGNKYRLSIMTSRGCINTCAFCSERPNFFKYRSRSADNVFKEILKHLYDLKANPFIKRDRAYVHHDTSTFNRIVKHFYDKYQFLSRNNLFRKTAKHFFHKYRSSNMNNLFGKFIKHVDDSLHFSSTGPVNNYSVNGVSLYLSFNDSLINGNPKELEELCDLVIKSGLHFSWGGMALIRKEMTYELLVKMKKAGCYNLSWGLESGCQEVLDLMHKKFFNMDLAKKIIKLTHKAQIRQSISLIAGFPGETEDMFQKTKAFLAEFKDYFEAVSAQPMVIVKNSLVYEKPEDFGIECANNYLHWQTTDGTNNYNIRLKRVEMLKSLLEGRMITLDR